MPNTFLVYFSLAIAVLNSPNVATAQDSSPDIPGIDFEIQIAPLLQQHCLRCHSPGINKGDISLATIADLETGDHLSPGKPTESYLVELITSEGNSKPEMPQDGPPLAKVEVDLIKQWIREGAKWPADVVIREKPKSDASFWAFQPLDTATASDSKTIDDFIITKLKEKDLAMRGIADRRTLIRRATFDLTGLPPTPEEVRAFALDPNEDRVAFAKLVDRLLESPHYGERWGRHWLDVVRFGESNGFERNVLINSLWPFRDYVIESINADKPFDQFIREHIAGDAIDRNDPNVAVGSAFLVAGPYDDVGNQDKAQAAQIRANTLDEIINSTGQAFLGMTLGCARCHDHKFDPITQEDYYSFYATFAGVRHGEVQLADEASIRERNETLAPLNLRKKQLEDERQKIRAAAINRGRDKMEQYEAKWVRPPVDRTGTTDTFETVLAKFIRLTCLTQDSNFLSSSGFRIDEFRIFSDTPIPKNVALASNGGKASGPARQIKDFANAYGPHLAIDGKYGERFIARSNYLTIELAQATKINRVEFSSAFEQPTPGHHIFTFVADYRIEVSLDGKTWKKVSDSRIRKPVNSGSHVDRRLEQLERTDEDRANFKRIEDELRTVRAAIAKAPVVSRVWIGTRNQQEAKGPFNVFVGGDPQRKAKEVVSASMSVIAGEGRPSFELNDASESERRLSMANWVADPTNPLTPRVLANRLWHYHFGTGIVDTPSDFGYMGGRPSHPELLDFLAAKLIDGKWKLKSMHQLMMNSKAYQQASTYDDVASRIDSDSRLLWRFPPRRLSAEEIRDTILNVSGKLDRKRGGPGFRLYDYLQDNVATYLPLDTHGPDTYRRAVYHQNARAALVDLMSDFDQPDCAFSAPRRAQTTTPLQALTMFNHQFTLDMAEALSRRVQADVGNQDSDQINRLYQLCYSRDPQIDEAELCKTMIKQNGLEALCRVLLNTSELIYLQ